MRGVVPLNAQTNQGTTPSGRRRRRSAPATIRKRSWGIPAERWAVHREILVGIVRHYPAAFKSGGEGGVHQDFPMYKKKDKLSCIRNIYRLLLNLFQSNQFTCRVTKIIVTR